MVVNTVVFVVSWSLLS